MSALKRKEQKFKYRNVLLLDDTELDNFINKKVIESTNFAEKIHSFAEGQKALDFLNKVNNKVGEVNSNYPELIFVDLSMPVMDGFQFINRLKATQKNWEKLKLVILTSSVSNEDRIKAREISEDIVFLSKPLTEAMLGQL